MKKIIIGIISAVLIILAFFSVWAHLVFKNSDQVRKVFNADNEKVFAFTHPFRKEVNQTFTFIIDREQAISLSYSKMDLCGEIKIRIEDDASRPVREIAAKSGRHQEQISLGEGKYTVKTSFNSFFGGFVIGLNLNKYFTDLKPLADTDGDGLPDEYENRYGTSVTKQDTDGDGLSDYLEVVKYKANPLKADSDLDGKNDGEWEERREYTYSIQAIVDLRVPFNLNDMNDLFQDARLIKRIDAKTFRMEVILYPETSLIINPAQYTPVAGIYTGTHLYQKLLGNNERKHQGAAQGRRNRSSSRH